MNLLMKNCKKQTKYYSILYEIQHLLLYMYICIFDKTNEEEVEKKIIFYY